MTSIWALTWCLCTNSFCSSCGRRASTAIVCKNWAALHENCSSGIWEAVNLSGVTPPGDGTPCRAALEAWLVRRAPGLRQLQLQDTTTPSLTIFQAADTTAYHAPTRSLHCECDLPRSRRYAGFARRPAPVASISSKC